MPYTYLLKLSNSKIYSGFTKNLQQRLKDHREGYNLSTKDFRPVKLIWYCVFPTLKQAQVFEKYLKTGSGQAFRNKRLIT